MKHDTQNTLDNQVEAFLRGIEKHSQQTVDAAPKKPEAHHPKNVERAGLSKNALAVFTEETYNGDHPDSMNQEDIRDAIQDLITDLFHYANQCGFDVKEIHRHAMGMYEEELAEPEF